MELDPRVHDVYDVTACDLSCLDTSEPTGANKQVK